MKNLRYQNVCGGLCQQWQIVSHNMDSTLLQTSCARGFARVLISFFNNQVIHSFINSHNHEVIHLLSHSFFHSLIRGRISKTLLLVLPYTLQGTYLPNFGIPCSNYQENRDHREVYNSSITKLCHIYVNGVDRLQKPLSNFCFPSTSVSTQ